MALIKKVRGFQPQMGQNVYLAENATIVGDVSIGDNCSIWFNAVLRGDVNSIIIGNDVNIQDGAVVHCTFEQSKTIIEDRVSVGHNAIIHGCHIKADVLVGMGSIIMDHAVVESNVLIAAGAVVLENSHLESGYIYAGVPAKKVKQISADRFNNTIHRISKNYAMYASWFTEDDTPKT